MTTSYICLAIGLELIHGLYLCTAHVDISNVSAGTLLRVPA